MGKNKISTTVFILMLLFFSFTFSSNPPGWIIQYTPAPNAFINDITFTDTLNGWAITTNGVDSSLIIKTTNGGTNWFQQFAMTNAAFDRIHMINSMTGYCVGIAFKGLILKTTNGGSNWLDMGFPGIQRFVDCSFKYTDTGWVCDDAPGFGGVWRTTNGGLNWQQQIGGQTVKNIFFVDGNTGWYTRDNNLYKSTNGGNNWIAYSGIPGIPNHLFFWNSDNGLATRIENGKRIYKTTNGGLTWIGQTAPDQFGAEDITYVNDSNIWIGSSVNRIIKKVGNDSIWGYQLTPLFANVRVDFINMNTGWAGFRSIAHTMDGGGPVTSVIPGNSGVLNNFELYQNYPNPFNPKTIINYTIKANKFQITGYVTLKVYDVLGNEVRTLVNKKQHIGSYKFEFDGTGLPGGIYFYTLRTDFGTITKKMLLVK